jgi:branched-chain amino acid transport system ATP-binding protein
MHMLDVRNLRVSYGAIEAVKGIDFHVDEGEVVSLIGSNGAGKTTTLRTISGLERARSGEILFEDKDITRVSPHDVVGMGITHIPEGRRIFTNLTIAENLRMAASLRKDKDGIKRDVDAVFDRFPRLKERMNQPGLTLSGGEQQMLAVGRAMVTRGKLIMMDEPSMGLAPMIVEEIFNVIHDLNKQGSTILLVEQNAFMALQYATRAYVLETGNVAIEGPANEMLKNPRVKEAYLGT